MKEIKRNDFEEIAKILSEFYLNGYSHQKSLTKNIIISLAYYFKRVDNKFDSDKFKKNCGLW